VALRTKAHSKNTFTEMSGGEESDLEYEELVENGRVVETQYLYRQRTLVLMSRGVGVRERHLVTDFMDLLPHAKKDYKLDLKKSLSMVNELAEMKNCNNVVYFESRSKVFEKFTPFCLFFLCFQREMICICGSARLQMVLR
jgi:hypothetical protein